MSFVSNTIWHVIEFLFHGNDVKESCNFENLLDEIPNGLTSIIHTKKVKSTKFSEMLPGP